MTVRRMKKSAKPTMTAGSTNTVVIKEYAYTRLGESAVTFLAISNNVFL